MGGKAVTPEAQRIAIAEACGWEALSGDWPFTTGLPKHWQGAESRMPLPDYLSDLNAMHAALKSQTQAFRAEFDRRLHAMAEGKHLLVTELESKDWADCFVSCLQSQRDSGNSTP